MTVETGIYGGIQMQDPNNEWAASGINRYTCTTSGFYSIDLDNQFYMFYKHSQSASFKYLSGTITYVARIYKVSLNGVGNCGTSNVTLTILSVISSLLYCGVSVGKTKDLKYSELKKFDV